MFIHVLVSYTPIDPVIIALANNQSIITSTATVQKEAFKSALAGISSGVMRYDQDPLLPVLRSGIERRVAEFKGLSPEEESKLLSLNAEQRRVVADLDRK